MTLPIFLATPPPPPPIAPRLDDGWERLEMRVEAAGRTWEVSDYASGVFFMPGVTGMSKPKVSHQEIDFANTHGSFWNGLTVGAREVFWPVYLFNDGDSTGYLEVIRSWWAALDPYETVRWYVRTPGGEERYLDVRLQDDGGPGSEYDDVYHGWSKHRITMSANQPFWRSKAVERTFVQPAPLPFLGPSGNNAPPIRPYRNASTQGAALHNPGDLDTYPTYRLEGAINPGAELEVNGRVIDIPFGLGTEDTLVIDTDVEAQTAYLNGVEVTHRMTGRFELEPLAKRTSTEIGIAYAGTGRVTVSVTPNYWRAYA